MTEKKTRRGARIGKTIATLMLGTALIAGCAHTTDDGSQGRDGPTGGNGGDQ